MGPKKKDTGKGKGKKEKDKPSGPSVAELQAELTTVKDEKSKQEQQRNYMQLERDSIHAFWEIKKRDYEVLRAELRTKDRHLEELEEQHQAEINVYSQKMKHVLYEQNSIISALRLDSEQALKLQSEQALIREQTFIDDQHVLKNSLKEMELSYEETIRQLNLEHVKEISIMHQEFQLRAKEVEQKAEKEVREVREHLDLRRKNDVHEIEERKNVHINGLMKKHEKAFTDIKCYYNDITKNNLDQIKLLKEDATDMKKKEAANEKLMYELAQENKKLTEPLTRALKEVEMLKKQLANYDHDKTLLAQRTAQVKARTKEFTDLEWAHQVLQQKLNQAETEAEEMLFKLEESIFEVQRKCGLKTMILEKKIDILNDTVEEKNAQIAEVIKVSDQDPAAFKEAEEQIATLLNTKNLLIHSLQHDLGKTKKAHNDIILAFEMKLAEYGIPLEEMGLAHYIANIL